MRFGGENDRPQGFGQASPQGFSTRPPRGLGGGSSYPGVRTAPGSGMPPGAGMQQPGTGMPPGAGMQQPGMGMPSGAGMQQPGMGMPSGSGMQQPGMGMPPGSGMQQPGMGIPPGAGMSPGGSIRNNLGSGLKSQGVFQKDGKINNMRGGFIGPKQGVAPTGVEGNGDPALNMGGGKMGSGPFSFLGNSGNGPAINQPRQLILEAAQAGLSANGIATISPDNVFTCIANLPSPNTLVGQGFGTYAAYLVDQKGSTGFLAGILRPVGNGVYQTQFRSQVPLAHYSRVIITVENPQQLGHVPRGPVILQVKQPTGLSRFLTPAKKAGGSIWQKISGFVGGRGKAPVVPPVTEGGTAVPDMLQSITPPDSLPPTP